MVVPAAASCLAIVQPSMNLSQACPVRNGATACEAHAGKAESRCATRALAQAWQEGRALAVLRVVPASPGDAVARGPGSGVNGWPADRGSGGRCAAFRALAARRKGGRAGPDRGQRGAGLMHERRHWVLARTSAVCNLVLRVREVKAQLEAVWRS